MFPVERMPELKRIILLHTCDGWKWYGWLVFAIFKFLCVCGQTKFAIDVKKDFMLFSYAAATYFIPLLGLAKLHSWLKYHSKIEQMYRTIEERFWDLNNTNKNLSNKLATRLSIISKIVSAHSLVSIGICTTIAIFPLVSFPDGRKNLPSAIWFPVNTDKAPIYEMIYTLLAISNHVSVLVNLNYDAIYVYFAQTLAVQFVLLKELLRNITEVPEIVGPYRYHSEKFQNVIEERLKTCIEHHDLLMRFSKDIQKIYSFCLGVQISLSILSLVFTAYILSMDHDDIVKILKLLAYASALTTQVLLYTLNGTEIERQIYKTVFSILTLIKKVTQ
ncbi:hypothetical protein Trydic_g20370 [Trypoxylus dichotomus]